MTQMNLNFRAAAKIISLVIILSGITNMLPAAVSLIYDEGDTALTFFLCGLSYTVVGMFLFFFIKTSKKRIKARDGILIISLAWLLTILLGALSLKLSADIRFIDALFESTSGFTTTGASVIDDVEALPKGVLFFRSLSNWIGGLAIVVLVISIMPMLGGGGQIIARAEVSRFMADKVVAKYTGKAKKLFLYYISITALCTLLLIPGQMGIFDSIIRAMGTVSTGGFSNYNEGMTQVSGFYEYWVLIFFMVFGSINFGLFYYLFSNRWKEFFRDTELRWYAIMLFCFSALLIINLLATETVSGLGFAITHGTFTLVSIMSTTGFASLDFVQWPTFAIMILLVAMIIGGCSASTSGGIKTFRIVVAVKLIKRNISRRLHPAVHSLIKDDEGPLAADLVSAVAAFIFFYVVIIFAGFLLLSLEDRSFVTTISAVISCLSNVGPGFEEVGPMFSYGDFSAWAKLVLSFVMVAGRLELFGLMLLFTQRFWNPDRVRV